MRLSRRAALIVFAAATVGVLLVNSLRVPTLIGLILTVLYLVLLGYLIECGLLPSAYWPFGKINLFELALSAACLVASLAVAMGILIAGAHRSVMIALAGMLILLLCGGMFFLVKSALAGRKR